MISAINSADHSSKMCLWRPLLTTDQSITVWVAELLILTTIYFRYVIMSWEWWCYRLWRWMCLRYLWRSMWWVRRSRTVYVLVLVLDFSIRTLVRTWFNLTFDILSTVSVFPCFSISVYLVLWVSVFQCFVLRSRVPVSRDSHLRFFRVSWGVFWIHFSFVSHFYCDYSVDTDSYY